MAIRDDISTTYPANKTLGRSFGVGAKLVASSTPGLLTVAGEILGIVAENKAIAQQAKDAGVSAARIKALGALSAKLEAAQGGQLDAIATSKTTTAGKAALLKAIGADVAYVRKVASVVFKGDAKTRAKFASQRPKHVQKKRTPVPS